MEVECALKEQILDFSLGRWREDVCRVWGNEKFVEMNLFPVGPSVLRKEAQLFSALSLSLLSWMFVFGAQVRGMDHVRKPFLSLSELRYYSVTRALNVGLGAFFPFFLLFGLRPDSFPSHFSLLFIRFFSLPPLLALCPNKRSFGSTTEGSLGLKGRRSCSLSALSFSLIVQTERRWSNPLQRSFLCMHGR